MKIFSGFCIFLVSSVSFAQAKTAAYRAEIKVPEAQIYKDPDFDSKVIAVVTAGKVFDVSSKTVNNAFYRIRIKPGVIGYISDVDVKPLFQSTGTTPSSAASSPTHSPTKKNAKKDEAKEKKEERKKNRPFIYTQYGGFSAAWLQYQEDTMGDQRKETVSFFGAKFSGPDLLVDGLFPSEINVLFHYGAPTYYESLTGNTADGWILIMDFLWQTYYPFGKNAFTFFGFGPMFKYSKYKVALTDSVGQKKYYSMDDFNLGAAFSGGVAFRVGSVALRGELQYFWEKQPYPGVALSAQFAF
ncbi:MAG: SH3 domain-containing protein [Pseudobdellovibrionaceae bacterium]